MKFFEELKKRNVYKAGAAYLITSWLLLQIVDVIGPNLGWPDTLGTLLTKILIVGLPITLVLAWLYELTPKGFKRTGTYQEEAADNKKAGRRLNYFIIGVLSIAVCFLLVDKLFLSEKSNQNQEASIAVLPFNFLSTVDSLSFMSEALSGAISDKLSKVSGLVVIGKTSSSQFRIQGDLVKEIRQKLNVNYLMEGDLLLESNRIRLSTRLINTLNGRVQWQKKYDQDFETVMDLEDDIADNVVRELRVDVFPDEFLRLRKKVAKNTEAYKLYLKGEQLGQKRDQESLRQAITLIEEAIILEPDFAKAHAELVILYQLLHNYGELNRDIMVEKMQDHLHKAQSIDAELPEVLTASARVEGVINRDTSKALAYVRKAIQINDNYAPAYYALGNQLERMGMQSGAIQALKKAYQLDPYNDTYVYRLAGVYYYNEDEPEKAWELINRMLEEDPSAWLTAGRKASILWREPYGDLAGSFITIHKTREDNQYEAFQLALMVDRCLSLDLAPIAERFVNLLQGRYPSNRLILGRQSKLYLFNKDFRDNIDLIKAWAANGKISEDEATISLVKQYISLHQYAKAEELLKSLYPELSKTLDSIDSDGKLPNYEYRIIIFFLEIRKAKGEDDKIDMILKQLYENEKGWHENFYALKNYYYLKGEVDSLVYHLDKAWFEKKDRGRYPILENYRMGDFQDLEKEPLFMDFINKVLDETHRQRAEVIEYLKEQGDWDPAWDKELLLE
ncbi:hypothetical protein [Muriicola soli]|uniref:Uncharacterized protein n=1 Tax=Muriicola soli TaxID=2507538 RepID=A0A411EBR8_9FLAO|nr:hypothetical protein [Muriicola soli]QBA64957.1 hypothetical protein EQY75_10720 [Muriicola soli]